MKSSSLSNSSFKSSLVFKYLEAKYFNLSSCAMMISSYSSSSASQSLQSHSSVIPSSSKISGLCSYKPLTKWISSFFFFFYSPIQVSLLLIFTVVLLTSLFLFVTLFVTVINIFISPLQFFLL